MLGTSSNNEKKSTANAAADGSIKQFLKVRMNLVNLLVFVFLFSTASFDYYLINFYLKYVPGNVFVNTIVSSVSSATANCIAGSIVVRAGSRSAMTCTYGLCAAAAFLLLLAESSQALSLVPFTVLAA